MLASVTTTRLLDSRMESFSIMTRKNFIWPEYTGLVLAGGEGKRMGGRDKGLVFWQDKPLIEHAITHLHHQTPPPQTMLISANRNASAYLTYGGLVISDLRSGFNGPLAGIEAALKATETEWLYCIPCDMPALPNSLFYQLYKAAREHRSKAVYARTNFESYPICCLMHRDLTSQLIQFLDNGHRKMLAWLAQCNASSVEFKEPRSFVNLNTLISLTKEN